MEVPTIVSYSFLQQLSVELPVDTPLPHGGFACGGLQDFPRTSVTFLVFMEIFKVFAQGQGFNSAERSHSSPSS